MVKKSGSDVVYPGVPASRPVASLPPEVEAAWGEVRQAFSVGAYTAAEMMCRKILMHVAVDVAGSQPGRTFAQYIDDLEANDYVMTSLKPAVDLVRQRGNVANHDLPASTRHEALQTITITEHLLEGIYELPGLVPPPHMPSP